MHDPERKTNIERSSAILAIPKPTCAYVALARQWFVSDQTSLLAPAGSERVEKGFVQLLSSFFFLFVI